MRITGLETIRMGTVPNLCHVLVHTDEGVTGLGETFLGAAAVEAWIHESAAPYLLDQDPLRIEQHWQGLKGFVGMNSSGAENRGRSAIDIALWDLFGKVTGLPLYQLLGGKVRDSIAVYNTCAGYYYARDIPIAGEVSTRNWQLQDGETSGPYEDMRAFLDHPGELAEDLLAQGITGMKMWPFDLWSAASDGHYINSADLERGVELFQQIRDKVGTQMDIMVDLHTNWDLPTAIRIARALREVAPAWIEDPIRTDDIGALRDFRVNAGLPVVAGETLATRWSYRDLLNQRAVDVVMCDPVWAGGVSEARRVGAMCEAYQTPVTMHDCNGPVQFAVATHLSVHLPNAYVQESVRAYYTGWYLQIAEGFPAVSAGRVSPPSTPGHGVGLREDSVNGAALRRRSDLSSTR